MRKKTIIDGKDEKFTPSSLDQVWGDTGIHKYKTLKVEEYQAYLNEMNKSDLQSHARTIGLIPLDNTEMLKKRLIREFNSFVASYKFPKEAPSVPKKPSSAASKILSEGR